MTYKRNCVKSLLNEVGLTQTQLADQLGADRVNLNKIINNKRGLDHDLAKQIAKILNVNWFEIYEPMNLEMPIMGTLDENYKIKMHTMADDKIEIVTLFHYLADIENLICVKNLFTNALVLIDKRFKSDKLKFYGYHYGKKKNGDLFFAMHNVDGFFELTGAVLLTKKINMKNIEYVMPVSRIDFDYKYKDPALEKKYAYDIKQKPREPDSYIR